MATMFCTHCGFVVARGDIDDPARTQAEANTACPGCGAAGGIAYAPSDLTKQEIGSMMDPQHTMTARPGERPSELVDRMMSEVLGRESGASTRARAKQWLTHIGLVMLIVSASAVGVIFYYTRDWAQAVIGGLVAGFTGAMIADRFNPSPPLD